jgi:hypothetical protein
MLGEKFANSWRLHNGKTQLNLPAKKKFASHWHVSSLIDDKIESIVDTWMRFERENGKLSHAI